MAPLAPSSGDLDTEALDWFVRQDGAPGAAPSADLQAWLAGHPARQAAFARWQADDRRLGALPAPAIDHLRRQLAADKAAAARPAADRPRAGRWAWLRGGQSLVPQAALAAMVLATAGGGGYLAWDHWQQQPVFAQDFSTGRGQQLDVQLPDGSRLRLDTATRVEVVLYRQRREVRLPEGQALFQVQGDATRPFDVLAGGVKVTVVGTRFSVRHTVGVPGDAAVRVAVEEGRVRVAAPATNAVEAAAGHAPAEPAEPVLLTAGQQVRADADGRLGPVAPVAAAGVAPWRDGRISLDDVPLAQALAEFERYGPTQLLVHDPAVAALRVTGTFDPRRLDSFRQALPKVLPVRLQAGPGPQSEIVAVP
ncbi:MAG: Fe2+-dicitrate sensor protein [Comamonadaceae bacterium]|nr:MAG: Fe2+-dicitrate sensor protein [Comamonadaceae bacterium]